MLLKEAVSCCHVLHLLNTDVLLLLFVCIIRSSSVETRSPQRSTNNHVGPPNVQMGARMSFFLLFFVVPSLKRE